MIQPTSLNLTLIAFLVSCSSGQDVYNSEERSAIVQVFNANDLDKDSCLSMLEWRKMVEAATDAIKNQSSNADQFRNWNLEIFSEIDTNDDKCASLPEYIRFSNKSRVTGTQAVPERESSADTILN